MEIDKLINNIKSETHGFYVIETSSNNLKIIEKNIKNIFFNKQYEIDTSFMNLMPEENAKFIFQLSVPLEIAIQRNSLRTKFGKETEAEIKQRFAINSEAQFLGDNYHTIDATQPFEMVLKQVIKELWHSDNWR